MALIYDVAFNSGTRILSLLDKAGNVVSSCEVPSKNTELTLKATADNSSVALTKNGTLSNTYEVNTGSGWEAYTFGTAINLNAGQSCKWRCSAHPTTQSSSAYVKFVMTGKIEALGNVNSMLSSDFENMYSISRYSYAFYRLFRDCTSLTKAPELPAMTLAQYCYTLMFESCTALTQAPSLPATLLANNCYMEMFSNCTALTQAPELPVTNLSLSCYYGMFYGCTALTKAPELTATNLPQSCYAYMFRNCSSLAEVRIRATTIAGADALLFWLLDVAATGDFYCDPNATIFPTDSEDGIPSGWNRFVLGAEDTGNTTKMYHNGATEIVRVGASSYGTCYSAQGWAGFKTLAQMHDLGYTLGAQSSLTMYEYDFPVPAYLCEANAGDGFTETMYDVGDGNGYLTIAQQNANGYHLTLKPFTGLTLTATADNSSVKLTKNGTLSNTYVVNTGSGWTAYTFGTAINLNNGESCKWRCKSHPTTPSSYNYVKFVMTGTIEASGNCNSMLSSAFENITSLYGYDFAFIFLFSGCTALTKAPDLPARTLANNCYQAMFNGCTALTKAPELPATTIRQYCYISLFNGCTALTKAPELPATILQQHCYRSMFGGCTSLTKAPELPARTLANNCYQGMFNGCTNLLEIRTYAANPTTASSNGSVYQWLKEVSATGDFYCNPNTTWASGASGIPQNWTRHDIADYPQT